MNPGNWKKANFQVQSRAWFGITDGRKNTNEEIEKVYKSMGYDIIATSDYQKINLYKKDEPFYIPVYEHGYSIRKVHQVLIGSERVLWRDYPLFQNLNHKQNIINLLRPDNDIIVIAHPNFEKGYKPENMKWLGNYDAIEVLNYFRRSFEHWDTALSSGNFVTIIGDDDVHDIFNPNEVGQYMTFINAPVVNRQEVVHSIRNGNTIGTYVYRPIGESYETKIEKVKEIQSLESFAVTGDTIKITVSEPAKEIVFVGQDGKIMSTLTGTNKAKYIFKLEDTYIRTEVTFNNRNAIYLNPACRFDGNLPTRIGPPQKNIAKTTILRIVGFATILFILINILVIRKRRKANRRIIGQG